MFPMKVKSDQADIDKIFRRSLDIGLLYQKTPPDTPNIPIESLYMNSNLSALLTYKLTLERKAVLAAEFLLPHMKSNQAKATTT